jgi:hypothetical protein
VQLQQHAACANVGSCVKGRGNDVQGEGGECSRVLLNDKNGIAHSLGLIPIENCQDTLDSVHKRSLSMLLPLSAAREHVPLACILVAAAPRSASNCWPVSHRLTLRCTEHPVLPHTHTTVTTTRVYHTLSTMSTTSATAMTNALLTAVASKLH